MTTSLQICQKAVAIIGANKPESFDDGTLEGEICNDVYSDLLKTMLSGRPWTFATKKVELTKAVEVSELGLSNVFILPSEVIKIFTDRTALDYELVAGKLHTNSDSVSLKYAYMPNETFMSADFLQALKYGIAAEINLPITGNTSRTEYLERKFAKLLKKAGFTDSRSKPNTSMRNYKLLSVRN